MTTIAIVDAWMQYPSRMLLADPMFDSLRAWSHGGHGRSWSCSGQTTPRGLRPTAWLASTPLGWTRTPWSSSCARQRPTRLRACVMDQTRLAIPVIDMWAPVVPSAEIMAQFKRCVRERGFRGRICRHGPDHPVGRRASAVRGHRLAGYSPNPVEQPCCRD